MLLVRSRYNAMVGQKGNTKSILAFVTTRPVIRALLNQPHKKALDLVNSEYLLIQSCDMCDLQSADRDMTAAGVAPLSHVKETISGLSEMEAGRESRFKLWTINKI